MERGKRVEIKPIDEHNKYAEFIKEIRKHPYKLYEYHTGDKLPLWKRIYMDIVCKFNKMN